MQGLLVLTGIIIFLIIVAGFFIAKWSKESTENNLNDLEKESLDKNMEIFNKVNKAQQSTREKYAKLRDTLSNTDIN